MFEELQQLSNLKLVKPLDYLSFMHLMAEARMVLTDSGGVQEETTALGVPCLTMRDNTERPVTCDLGTNILTGTKYNNVMAGYQQILQEYPDSAEPYPPKRPPLWDGSAAQRIVALIQKTYCSPARQAA